MKTDGIEAPVAPVLGAPRRSRDRARIAAVAVVAVAVLAVGIGLAGNGFTVAPSATGSRAPSGSTVAQASGQEPGGSLQPPTKSPVLPCAPVRIGQPPEIRLTANYGSMQVPGVAGPSPSAGAGSGGQAWPVLPIGGALRAAQSSLDLAAQEDGCIRYVVADYEPSVPGTGADTIPYPIAFRTLNVSPPQPVVSLGSLPAGDWTVRIVAYFSTGQAGQEDASVIERFFRVITSPSDDAVPIPTPLTTPAVACAPLPRDGGPPRLDLVGSANGPVRGTDDVSAPSVVPVRIGDRIEVRVSGDACAIAWAFTTTPQGIPDFQQSDGEPNPGNNPFLFAQNRWLLHDLPTGRVIVAVTLRFSADVSTAARWLLDVQGGDVPAVRVVAPDGTSAVTAPTPCGTGWSRVGTTSGFEYCTDAALPATIPSLVAADESLIRVEVPGWTIVTWGGSCGRADPPGSATPFVVVSGCDLGGWYSDGGRNAPTPVAFLSRAAVPLYRIFVEAARGDEVVSTTVYVEIRASR